MEKRISILIGISIAVATMVVGGFFGYQYIVKSQILVTNTQINPNIQNSEQQKQNSSDQPSITVISPSGGETWKVGETHNIAWTSSDVKNMKLSFVFSTDIAGQESSRIIANVAVSKGFYSWKIGDIISGNVYLPNPTEIPIKILISDDDSSAVAYSNYFKVIK